MGFFDNVLGRRKAVQPDLDQLFRLPAAAITLQASLDFVATGVGSVAFRAPEGRAFADVQSEIQDLLDADGGPRVEAIRDDFGFTWLVVRHDPNDVAGLVTDLHAINATLKDTGFGPTLLCSLVSFRGPGGPGGPDGQVLGMVYLFKQGTFYPFVPLVQPQRDNIAEIQIRDTVGSDLSFEPDLGRWFAVWGAPGLE
ncbi:MAG: hypothetical protein V9E98_08815 [Candidatus Nanopelagicales bacterium]